MKKIFLPFLAVGIAASTMASLLFTQGELKTPLSKPEHEINQDTIKNNLTSSSTTDSDKILDFNSQLRKLPNSLNGTLLDFQLTIDDEGHLILADDIKYIFDFFLSTINEEELDIIKSRIDEYLNHYLKEPALSESKNIFAQYIGMKVALFELEKELGSEKLNLETDQLAKGSYLELLNYRLNRRNTLRAEYLDPEVNAIFYHEEEVYDEFTLTRLQLNSDPELTPDERSQKVNELQKMLPEDVQKSMRNTQIIDELKIKTNKLLAEGGDQQQVNELRKQMFGEEAAQRFDVLDQARAQWANRMEEYLKQREVLLNTEGLPRDEIQLQVNTLRETHFDPSEQMKAKIFEKRSEA